MVIKKITKKLVVVLHILSYCKKSIGSEGWFDCYKDWREGKLNLSRSGRGVEEAVKIQLNGSQERDRRNIKNMSPKRVVAQLLENNLVNMKIFILLKNIRLIIISKTPNPFNLKLG